MLIRRHDYTSFRVTANQTLTDAEATSSSGSLLGTGKSAARSTRCSERATDVPPPPAPRRPATSRALFITRARGSHGGRRWDWREDEGHRKAHHPSGTLLLFLSRIEAASEHARRRHGRPLLPQRLPRLRRRGRGPRRRRRPARWAPGPALAPVRQALRPLPPLRAPAQGQGTPPRYSIALPGFLPRARQLLD